MMRKLVAVIACRNNGSRLYGKPLQNIDIDEKITIISHIVGVLQNVNSIKEIIVAASAKPGNDIYQAVASELGLRIVVGDDSDVLKRLIQGLELGEGTDLFRVTSESPFPYWRGIEQAWHNHISTKSCATFLDDIIDGCGFEIITKEALTSSWDNGSEQHRSEMCTLYIRENKNRYKVNKILPPTGLIRKDLRLTVDYPEDLVVCRHIYAHLKEKSNPLKYELEEIVSFLDESPGLKSLLQPFVDAGYSTMYL